MTPKIVCVAGPTACGKTTLGVLLARRFHGEVVSADSMQIYRGMTVGSATAIMWWGTPCISASVGAAVPTVMPR